MEIISLKFVVVLLFGVHASHQQNNTSPFDKIANLLRTAQHQLRKANLGNENAPTEFWQATAHFMKQPENEQPQLAKKLAEHLFAEQWDSSCGCSITILLAFLTYTRSVSAYDFLWEHMRSSGVLDAKPFLIFSVNVQVRHILNCCLHAMPEIEQDALYALLTKVAVERNQYVEQVERELMSTDNLAFTNKTLLIVNQLSYAPETLVQIVKQVSPALGSGSLSVTRAGELLLGKPKTFCKVASAIQEALTPQTPACQTLRMYMSILDALPTVREYISTDDFAQNCASLAKVVTSAYQRVRSTISEEELSACLQNSWLEALRLSLADAKDSVNTPAVKVRVLVQRRFSVDLENLMRSLDVGPCAEHAIQAQATRETGLEDTAGTLMRVVILKEMMNHSATVGADRKICQRVLSEMPNWANRLSRGGNCQLTNRLTSRKLNLWLSFDAVGAARFSSEDGHHLQLDADDDKTKISMRPMANIESQKWFMEPAQGSTEGKEFFNVFVDASFKQLDLIDDSVDCTSKRCTNDVLLSHKHWSIECI